MDKMFETFRQREKERVEHEMNYRDYVDKVDALAEERGVSRSAFLRQVVLSFLEERQGEE